MVAVIVIVEVWSTVEFLNEEFDLVVTVCDGAK